MEINKDYNIMFTKEIEKIFPNTTAVLSNKDLTIGGCSLTELANTYGTPLPTNVYIM